MKVTDNEIVKVRKSQFYPRYIKRGIDLIISFLLLVILWPLFLILAGWIKLDSSGPVFFRQERMGKNGRPFKIYKFRTMYINAPQLATASFENPEKYITKVGKWLRKSSLDELPQLINVFKGEMSIIGPRPLILEEKKVLTLRYANGAEAVLPGITGLAQVRGRDLVTDEQKAAYDGEYAANLTLAEDARICYKTFFDVICSRGIHEGKKDNK